MSLVGSVDAVQRIATKGFVHEFTIGAADIDMTVDPATGLIQIGPCLRLGVLSGSGSLVYVDDELGQVHTLTGLSAASEDIDLIAVRTILGTAHAGTPSAALTLRGGW